VVSNQIIGYLINNCTQNISVAGSVDDYSAVNSNDNQLVQHRDEDHDPSICYRTKETSRQPE
jgi:hypothetical protein